MSWAAHTVFPTTPRGAAPSRLFAKASTVFANGMMVDASSDRRARGVHRLVSCAGADSRSSPTAAPTFAASSLLASLALSALPALAIIDSDGVETPNIFTSIFFTLAVALLAVCTVGILYLAAREALDKNEENNLREEDARAERVMAANKGRIQGSAGPSGSKGKKKKLSPSQQVSNDGPNRRERRKMERSGTQDSGDDE
uniref:Uncharacterized protein n=1 Tax=Mantoniella antarctica TaxID=81844 RepID=A0A7S0XHN0_9CHLO